MGFLNFSTSYFIFKLYLCQKKKHLVYIVPNEETIHYLNYSFNDCLM